MKLKTSLIILTMVSVICDTMLLPFYPRFFEEVFSINSSEHVGYFIAACCFTVMSVFPIWAKIAKRIHEVHLWVYTQLIAAGLGIACFHASTIVEFWVLSQLMLVFKASYLLIYPFVMKLEEKDQHLGMVGLFSVLMHFGGIGGALLGGWVLEYLNPRTLYLIMASGDILQVTVCLLLIKKFQFKWKAQIKAEAIQQQPVSRFSLVEWLKEVFYETSSPLIFRLCVVSLLLYFSAFLVRPFFAIYWERISAIDNATLTGFVFSIPGWIALLGLLYNHYSKKVGSVYTEVLRALSIGMIGLFLQASDTTWGILLGRCIYGVALFQVTVKLEVLMFKLSDPHAYTNDFSKLHLFQNIGVLISSLAVGHMVTSLSIPYLFLITLAGFMLSSVLFFTLLKPVWDYTDKRDSVEPSLLAKETR